MIPWMPPPNFFGYWCARDERSVSAADRFDRQHVVMDKTKDEYNDWKKKHDEEMQRAIKNHPIASTFLNLTKNGDG